MPARGVDVGFSQLLWGKASMIRHDGHRSQWMPEIAPIFAADRTAVIRRMSPLAHSSRGNWAITSVYKVFKLEYLAGFL